MFANFFAGFTVEELIVGFVGALIALSQGLIPGVSILEYLKNKYGIEDVKMQSLVVAFFFILAGLATYATGGFIDFEFTLKAIGGFFGVFLTLGQLGYQLLKAQRGY